MTDKKHIKTIEDEKELIQFQGLIDAKFSSYIHQDLCKITALSFLIVLVDTQDIDDIMWMKVIIGISSIICILTTIYGLSLNSKWINTMIDNNREYFLESTMKVTNCLSNWSFVIAIVSIIIAKLYF